MTGEQRRVIRTARDRCVRERFAARNTARHQSSPRVDTDRVERLRAAIALGCPTPRHQQLRSVLRMLEAPKVKSSGASTSGKRRADAAN